MKQVYLSIILLFMMGCMPASQDEVLRLTEVVNTIVPTVREVVSDSSQETKDKVEVVLKQVEDINKEVATADNPLDAAEKGWDATAPFNPYYGYGAAAIAILKALQLGKRKKETETALQEVVKGVEGADKTQALKDSLNKAQSVATRNMVSLICNQIA